VGGKELPIIGFPSQRAWERWLAENHDSKPGLWLKISKKGAGEKSVTYAQALEVALCFGWIDGQKAALDEQYWLQRFTPRSAKSRWSEINRRKAQSLIDEGRMRGAGMVCVEAARADGRWQAAYQGQRTASVPQDLREELERRPRAKEFFQTLDSANRYAILYRLSEAKLPATRERRMQKYLKMLEAQEKIHG
jgi:uncharacterized protein YdeI (YjbR/CyaY-like superfamily)